MNGIDNVRTPIQERLTGWKKNTLGDLCLDNGKYGINASAVKFRNDLPAYIRITDIDDDGNFSPLKRKSVNERGWENFLLKDGDILFVRTGSTTGKSYLYKSKDGKLVYAGFLIRFRPNKEKLLPNYLSHFTKTSFYNKWVSVMSVRSGQPGINSSEYAKLPILTPPLPEQQKIAAILSTWDEAIEKTQQLIEQLELRKKGLMQELLTGKKRLHRFDGEWKEVRLGDYLRKHSEVSDYSNQYPVLTSSREGMFFQSDYYTRDVASKDNTGYNVVPRGYFTYRHMSDDLIFKFNINKLCDRGIVSTLYPVFTTKDGLKDEYLEMVLNHGEEFKRYALKQKQGGSRTYMYFKKLQELKINLPNHSEQKAIMDFVDLINKEISEFNNKLGELKKQKKGLMQELLTGKKRVKIDE